MNDESAALDLQKIRAPDILNSLPDGAYITDCERRITFWSAAAERITGWTAAEVVGHSCADNLLVHIDKDGNSLCGKDNCPLHRAIVTGETSGEPLLVYAQHKQGRRIPVEVSVAPLRDSAGNAVGGIEVFRDWTSVLDDLRRAKAIQDHTLDSKLPHDPRVSFEVRYTPEDLIGGDFYRIEATNEDTYAVMVADVMGHGLASALYTMQLRSLWEECHQFLGSPDGFLTELNRRLYRFTSPEGYFATGFLAVLNAASGDLDYVNAGHTAPILLRGSGQVEQLSQRSPALGLIEQATFKTRRATLGQGDTLLLFTDGAVETLNAQGEELGSEGLIRILRGFNSTSVDLAVLESKLLLHSGRIRLEDDLTLLKISRNASVDRGS